MTKHQCPKLEQNSRRGRRERRLVIGHWALGIKAIERTPGLIQRQWGRGEGECNLRPESLPEQLPLVIRAEGLVNTSSASQTLLLRHLDLVSIAQPEIV